LATPSLAWLTKPVGAIQACREYKSVVIDIERRTVGCRFI
jgi:hypothetical protein